MLGHYMITIEPNVFTWAIALGLCIVVIKLLLEFLNVLKVIFTDYHWFSYLVNAL